MAKFNISNFYDLPSAEIHAHEMLSLSYRNPDSLPRSVNQINRFLAVYLDSRSGPFSRAPSRFMNQWTFRHSALNLPLKLSMKALSVGLPGREKSKVTFFVYAHRPQDHHLLE